MTLSALNGRVTCYPQTRDPRTARAIAVLNAHRHLDTITGSCGIWHHRELTPEQVAEYPADRWPALPAGFTPAGWVDCWQHTDPAGCPGPDTTGGHAHEDITLPAFERIRWAFQGCTCHVLRTALDAAWESFGAVRADATKQLVQAWLTAYRLHVINDDHPVLLPPAFPRQPGVTVVLAMYQQHRTYADPNQGRAEAARVWDEFMAPYPGDDDAHEFDWREGVAVSAKAALTETAYLYRAAWRDRMGLTAYQDCPEGAQ